MGIRTLRARRGLTQTRLAELTGLAQPSIAQYETGVMNPERMSLMTARKLCKALNCSPWELLEDDTTDAASKDAADHGRH
ncbi:helix-turn-helix domain-containing protein [Bifidobacterium apri]|uniref:Cro/C1-type HTH DNA-binding domain-containing protein n=1 Tax=Bifidobacterium apri TaxID=1769423 RepID=A0A6A2VD68_9BIFI|nr:Cro/C1-type HTH DNA-binding domain-containing protein [Bifidobacterium apri]